MSLAERKRTALLVQFMWRWIFAASLSVGWVGAMIGQTPVSPAAQNPSPMTDSTRPHPRIEKREVAGDRIALSMGNLFLSRHIRIERSLPLLVHFHGSPWLVEMEAGKSLPGVALITVQLGAGSGVYSKAFEDASRFESLLTEAAEKMQAKFGHEVRWKSVSLSSFSAGYGAIRSILQVPQNYSKVKGIILADSLHTSYSPEGKPPGIEEGPLEVFARFAADASAGRKFMWVTNSEVYPGTFVSTTETTDFLLNRLQLRRKWVLRAGPIGMQQLSEAREGKFILLGFAGNSAPDHLDHLYALGSWFEKLKHWIE